MPAPQASMMKQLARLKFTSFALKAGHEKTDVNGHYNKGFKSSELAVPPGMPPLFQPTNPNKYSVDTQKQHIKDIGAFIDGICDAICSAWGQWQSAATMVGVMISGPVASVGQVVGLPLMPLIMASAPKETPMLLKYSNVVATIFGTAWLSYTATIKVPGLPWYPAFAAVPSPVGPPMPNTPVPVIALTQVTASLMPAAMQNQMVGMLADPMAPFHSKLFEAICDAIDKCFKIWQAATQVTNVIGTGPVPSFAPPYVPVGPVVGGVGTMVPGGFT